MRPTISAPVRFAIVNQKKKERQRCLLLQLLQITFGTEKSDWIAIGPNSWKPLPNWGCYASYDEVASRLRSKRAATWLFNSAIVNFVYEYDNNNVDRLIWAGSCSSSRGCVRYTIVHLWSGSDPESLYSTVLHRYPPTLWVSAAIWFYQIDHQ